MAEAKKAGADQASNKPTKTLNGGIDPSVGKKTQFKKGKSGNPAGKPKGAKHLSTWIQDMLNDDAFKGWIQHPVRGVEEVSGAPIKAIVATAVIRAMNGEKESREWLAKYGYGTKVELEHSGDVGLFGTDALTVRVINASTDNTQPEATDGV